jgi:GNAT superfamily N-acetyltransferase
MSDPLALREATRDDIAALVKHRRWMFDDMRAVQPVNYASGDLDLMEPAYQEYLERHLGGLLRAWVVEADDRIVASGAVLFYEWPPRPGDSVGKAALIHSVYTHPDFRRRGLARRIAQTLVDVCRDLGLRTVTLHASQAGRPLYDAMGFGATSEMRLILR